MTGPLPLSPHMSYGQMRMILYQVAQELTVGSAILPDDLNGIYRMATDTIVIDRSMTYTRKRCTLVHELVHRMYGDAGCGHRERRCRMTTARLLIDEDDYRVAEAMYDGDPWLMAEELNVTPQIVMDYQERLHDNAVVFKEGKE